jgi:ubiquinone/menaquinone biosynthesis C-methylase UbiE
MKAQAEMLSLLPPGRDRTAWKPTRSPGPVWLLARLLISSSKDHAFLDRAWLPWVMRCTPRGWREGLALRLLAFSPHYWIYLDYYPATLGRSEVLRREHQRNLASRRELCNKVLRRFLRPTQTVLDFGCGPGFLARAVSPHVRQVVAADVSRGVIACARVLNGAGNIRYVANTLRGLPAVADASIDLVYSFAVIQHLRKEQTECFFREFARVLRPGGQGVIHVLLGESTVLESKGWHARRVDLRRACFAEEEIIALAREAGFEDVHIVPVGSLCDIDDEIGAEHLLLFRR